MEVGIYVDCSIHLLNYKDQCRLVPVLFAVLQKYFNSTNQDISKVVRFAQEGNTGTSTWKRESKILMRTLRFITEMNKVITLLHLLHLQKKGVTSLIELMMKNK